MDYVEIIVYYSLCCVKSQFKVCTPVLWVELVEVEGIRVEVMNQSTKCNPIIPGRGKVGDFNFLEKRIQ